VDAHRAQGRLRFPQLPAALRCRPTARDRRRILGNPGTTVSTNSTISSIAPRQNPSHACTSKNLEITGVLLNDLLQGKNFLFVMTSDGF
jgi:hypothetical protein